MPNNEKYRRKTKREQVDFNEEDREIVIKCMEREGRAKFSPFAREIILAYCKGHKTGSKKQRNRESAKMVHDLNKVTLELTRIGVNINQIAHKLNMTFNPSLLEGDKAQLRLLDDKLNDTREAIIELLNDYQPKK